MSEHIRFKYPNKRKISDGYYIEKEVISIQNHKLQQKVFLILYLNVILIFIYLIIMEIKRQYGVDFIPGFNNPLQDLYNDLMKDF